MNRDQLAARRATWRAARLEDLDFMAVTGETVPGAAARLGIHPHTLRDFLHQNKRGDLFARLLANQDDRGFAGPLARIPHGGRRAA